MRPLRRLYRLYLSSDRGFARTIQAITGYTPINTDVYRLAFKHSSLVKNPKTSALECNERLEYLGDSILGAVVAEYLYKRYPFKNEGFLTEMRSKIVSRASLNEIGERLEFETLIEFNKKTMTFRASMYGNTLEAFIGALYLDQGYHRTRNFIIKRLITTLLNIDEIQETNNNFKSLLMELVQKLKVEPMVYEVVNEKGHPSNREFTVICRIKNKVMGYGTDMKKKNAEQKASEMAYNLILQFGEDYNDWIEVNPPGRKKNKSKKEETAPENTEAAIAETFAEETLANDAQAVVNEELMELTEEELENEFQLSFKTEEQLEAEDHWLDEAFEEEPSFLNDDDFDSEKE